jgi:beta-xylosidase
MNRFSLAKVSARLVLSGTQMASVVGSTTDFPFPRKTFRRIRGAVLALGVFTGAVFPPDASAKNDAPSAQSKEVPMSGNPVLKGWYADPEGIIYGDTYWIYPTYSDNFGKQTFFDCFSSKDLVTWTKHASILTTAEVKWAKKAMWAPSVIKKGDKYYFFFSANDVHKGEIGGIGVAVSDRPEGPYKDLLGKPLINEIVNGAQPIDQFVFKDGDDYYMYYGGWRHCNIVKLNDDFTALQPFADGKIYKEVTPKGYVEGPFMFKRNGKYYFMWSEGGWTGPNYSVAYAIADSPFGPFKRVGEILRQDPAVATGAGHHSVIHIPGTEDYYIVYHRRPLKDRNANHRATCIDKMTFDKNGFINPVKITFEGVKARRLPGVEK